MFFERHTFEMIKKNKTLETKILRLLVVGTIVTTTLLGERMEAQKNTFQVYPFLINQTKVMTSFPNEHGNGSK